MPTTDSGQDAVGPAALLHARYIQTFCFLLQALAVPAIVSGQDAVVAAETGSGKTLAYLVPLVSQLLARSQAQALTAEPAADADAAAAERAERYYPIETHRTGNISWNTWCRCCRSR